jgi:S-adenosylmethionine:tRNA ribosyltransferase-isomerase
MHLRMLASFDACIARCVHHPMLLSDFDFELPASLIAQSPRPRGRARMMVVRRDARTWEERSVADLPELLAPADLVVLNDTRVFPARLLGRREPSGGAVECLLIERVSEREWDALVHPGQKLKPGARLVFDDPVRAPGIALRAEVLERRFFGRRRLRFDVDDAAAFDAAVDRLGHVPLPPYIHRPDTDDDRERYQTIYARARGSVAAPTAGLHVDAGLLARFDERGIARTFVTHHVGYGTFKPIRTDDVDEHAMDAERFEIPIDAAEALEGTRGRGGRVVAVGTTTTRALESAGESGGRVRAGAAATDLFIRPGYTFRVVDALLTNFHLPRSSLLLLVSAFAGRDLVLDVYRDAVARGFHFYSYGDAMLIL